MVRGRRSCIIEQFGLSTELDVTGISESVTGAVTVKRMYSGECRVTCYSVPRHGAGTTYSYCASAYTHTGPELPLHFHFSRPNTGRVFALVDDKTQRKKTRVRIAKF